ncbi:MAG TPA: hypothetical protein VJX73_12525 [Terracidiphilus sp.]|nr:hypothetical protein [Terracidiphilus sp.]
MLQLNLDGKMEFDPVLGEDTWELFEVIEDSFGVDFGDYHDICGITVGELATVICKKANYPTEDKCLSAVTFYRIRRAFGALFGAPRSTIRPSASVADLLPLKHRAKGWELLQEHLGLNLPRLQFPAWLFLLAIVIPPTLLVFLRAFLGIRISAIWMLSISCALYMVTFVSIIPAIDERFSIPRVLPKTCRTFGELVKFVSAHNFAALGASSSENSVYKALQQLVAMQLGIDVAGLYPNTRIPDDLNIY